MAPPLHVSNGLTRPVDTSSGPYVL